jgi:hypothetical protein
VDAFYSLRIKGDPIIREVLIEASKAPLDSEYLLDAIVIPKTHDEGPNNNIEARAKSSASNDPSHNFVPIEEYLLSSTSSQKLK